MSDSTQSDSKYLRYHNEEEDEGLGTAKFKQSDTFSLHSSQTEKASLHSSESDVRIYDEDSGVCNSTKATNSIDSLSDQGASKSESRDCYDDVPQSQVKIHSGGGLHLDYDEVHEVESDRSSQDVTSPCSDVKIEMTEIVTNKPDSNRDADFYTDDESDDDQTIHPSLYSSRSYRGDYNPMHRESKEEYAQFFSPNFEGSRGTWGSSAHSGLRSQDQVDEKITFSTVLGGNMYSQYSNPCPRSELHTSSDRVKIGKNFYPNTTSKPPFGDGQNQLEKVGKSVQPLLDHIEYAPTPNMPEARKLVPLTSGDNTNKKKKKVPKGELVKKYEKDSLSGPYDENRNPLKSIPLNPVYRQMRESPALGLRNANPSSNNTYGTAGGFPQTLNSFDLYQHNNHQIKDFGELEDYPSSAKLHKKHKQKKVKEQLSEDIDNYKGNILDVDELVRFIAGDDVDNKKTKKDLAATYIPGKDKKNKKPKDKKQKSLLSFSSIEEEKKGGYSGHKMSKLEVHSSDGQNNKSLEKKKENSGAFTDIDDFHPVPQEDEFQTVRKKIKKVKDASSLVQPKGPSQSPNIISKKKPGGKKSSSEQIQEKAVARVEDTDITQDLSTLAFPVVGKDFSKCDKSLPDRINNSTAGERKRMDDVTVAEETRIPTATKSDVLHDKASNDNAGERKRMDDVTVAEETRIPTATKSDVLHDKASNDNAGERKRMDDVTVAEETRIPTATKSDVLHDKASNDNAGERKRMDDVTVAEETRIPTATKSDVLHDKASNDNAGERKRMDDVTVAEETRIPTATKSDVLHDKASNDNGELVKKYEKDSLSGPHDENGNSLESNPLNPVYRQMRELPALGLRSANPSSKSTYGTAKGYPQTLNSFDFYPHNNHQIKDLGELEDSPSSSKLNKKRKQKKVKEQLSEDIDNYKGNILDVDELVRFIAGDDVDNKKTKKDPAATYIPGKDKKNKKVKDKKKKSLLSFSSMEEEKKGGYSGHKMSKLEVHSSDGENNESLEKKKENSGTFTDIDDFHPVPQEDEFQTVRKKIKKVKDANSFVQSKGPLQSPNIISKEKHLYAYASGGKKSSSEQIQEKAVARGSDTNMTQDLSTLASTAVGKDFSKCDKSLSDRIKSSTAGERKRMDDTVAEETRIPTATKSKVLRDKASSGNAGKRKRMDSVTVAEETRIPTATKSKVLHDKASSDNAGGPPKCSSSLHHSKSSTEVHEKISLNSSQSSLSLQGPEYILEEHFDACIIYCDADENGVYEFKDHLEKLDLGGGRHPKICLYTEEKVWGPAKLTDKVGFVCKHCTLMFVYLSKSCYQDEYADFIRNEVIMATIKNCRVRPVLSEKDCAIPHGLHNASSIDWYKRDSRSYKDNIVAVFIPIISERLRREEQGIKSVLSKLF